MLKTGTGIYDPANRPAPRLVAVVPDATPEQVIAETAKRERESKDPRYLAMIDAAIERARR